ITSSEGHILKEVNGKPVVEYFEDLGLTKASETSYAMTSLPFMLDYGDGTPMVSKVFIGLNEQKHAICAGVMPEGSTLYMGVFDKGDVLLTTGKLIRRAIEETPQSSVMIAYSCISRNMSLGSDIFAEMDLVRKEIAGKLTILMAYSGGEICPTQINKTAAINRFHNNTIVLCVF
ncbi:MAG: FIST C-terminal domain-containing protein, partial [Treponema sp.]|nr:FIST C-terminal domain-containing protein [Treponema sp.]